MELVGGAIGISVGNAIGGSDWCWWESDWYVGAIGVGGRVIGIGGREMRFFSYYLQVTIYIYNFIYYDFTKNSKHFIIIII